MTLQNDLLIRAAKGERTERVPVWLMRQAGRILPEYRKVRNSVSGFVELVTTPELAMEVTIQPVDILDVDAAIIFSDILVIPESMGLPYKMVEQKGPIFETTVSSEQDIKKLKVSDPESDLGYVAEAIRLTKKELNNRVPLIGFAGAPWTILSYMIEGSGSKTFSKARKILYTRPDLAHQLLEMITESTIRYLKMQIKEGADLVQIFDSWAGILPEDQYQDFGIRYISKICDAIDEVPITVFSKGAYFARREMGQLDCQTIGLDWNMNIQESRQLIGDGKTLQGNLDPCVLYDSPHQIETKTKAMLQAFGGHRHIANLGHGVYPDIDPERVKCFVNTVKEWQPGA